jgi:uncharacterized membrane protein YfcA
METATTTFWLFSAAFGASALGGVLGMASGIFIVPMLILSFGLDFRAAVGAGIFVPGNNAACRLRIAR